MHAADSLSKVTFSHAVFVNHSTLFRIHKGAFYWAGCVERTGVSLHLPPVSRELTPILRCTLFFPFRGLAIGANYSALSVEPCDESGFVSRRPAPRSIFQCSLSVEPCDESSKWRSRSRAGPAFSALSVEPCDESWRTSQATRLSCTFSALSVEPCDESLWPFFGDGGTTCFQCSLC